MPGEHDRVVRERGQLLQAVVHVLRIAARQVGASAALEEERVAADETALHMEALAAGGVAWRVDEGDLHTTDRHHVAAIVLDEIGLADARGTQHPRGLVLLHVDRAVGASKQSCHAFDRVPHHRTADVVGVIMGGQNAGAAHPVGLDRVEQIVHGVGRVDQHALAGAAIADRVDEVHHLGGDRVAHGEVPSGEELAEVELLRIHGCRLRNVAVTRAGQACVR